MPDKRERIKYKNIVDGEQKKQDEEYFKPTLYVLLPMIACRGITGEWGSTGSEYMEWDFFCLLRGPWL
jgi:hypothetical protein